MPRTESNSRVTPYLEQPGKGDRLLSGSSDKAPLICLRVLRGRDDCQGISDLLKKSNRFLANTITQEKKVLQAC